MPPLSLSLTPTRRAKYCELFHSINFLETRVSCLQRSRNFQKGDGLWGLRGIRVIHPGSPSTGPTEKGLIFGCYFFQKLYLPLTGSCWGAKKGGITSFSREHVACSSKGKIMPPHLVSCIFTSEWMGKCVSTQIFLMEKKEPLLVPRSTDIFELPSDAHSSKGTSCIQSWFSHHSKIFFHVHNTELSHTKHSRKPPWK